MSSNIFYLLIKLKHQKQKIALWSRLKFQNLIRAVNRELESLHDLVTVWLVVVVIIVMFIGGIILTRGYLRRLSLDSAILEVTWTIIPIVILVTIAIPRLNLLCLQDTLITPPKLRVKLTRNQWNWQSEQIERIDHLLDREKLDELSGYESPLCLPRIRLIRILLTRSDVLHSLGMPAIGLKIDSAPGRLNSVVFESASKGLFVGSCYELCGSGHSAIPIYILLL